LLSLKQLVSRKWIFSTLLVVAAIAVMARLGIWQLDRLEARRGFNAHVLEQQSAEPLDIDQSSLDIDLDSLEYRVATVTGSFLYADEFLLRNQAFSGQVGYQLFTPLLIEGTNTLVIIQRGWIPETSSSAVERDRYFQNGILEIEGMIRNPETDLGLRLIPDPTLSLGEARLDIWNNLDFDRIADQIDAPILESYIQILPDGSEEGFPRPLPVQLDLTEGPHLGYAGQWFLFALVLLIGYPIFVGRQSDSEQE